MNTRRSRRSSASAEGTGPMSDRPSYGEMPRPVENEDSSAQSSGSIASDFSETAKSAGQAVGDQAMAFASDIGHELSKKAEDQKSRGAEAIRAFAGAVDTAAQQLEQQSPQVARYVRDAAERARGLSKTIEERNLHELLHSATDVAKSNPVTFFAGAALVGFALSRFLKSSAKDDVAMSAADRGDGAEGSDYDTNSGGIAYGNP
jgi:hypothetical protein